jgi:acetyl esterase/lipase
MNETRSLSSLSRVPRLMLLIASVALGLSASWAQQLPSYVDKPSDASGLFSIWPGVPPGSEHATWHEQTSQVPGATAPNHMVRNVALPTITMFKPLPGKANGTSVIIAPGGAFCFLMVDYEGYTMARWLAQQGVTAFVLRYRVAHTPDDESGMPAFMQTLMTDLARPGPSVDGPPKGTPAMEEARLWGEEDGRQAIRYVRQHAAEWGIDPHRIGIAGFSAGGGVTMGAVMQHDAQSRPDFAAPIYAAYRTATPVPADAPPLFIALADDDALVAPIAEARLYEAWHAAGKSAELHIFSKGAHGFGMNKQNLPSDAWIDLFKTWLTNQGLMTPTQSPHP